MIVIMPTITKMGLNKINAQHIVCCINSCKRTIIFNSRRVDRGFLPFLKTNDICRNADVFADESVIVNGNLRLQGN